MKNLRQKFLTFFLNNFLKNVPGKLRSSIKALAPLILAGFIGAMAGTFIMGFVFPQFSSFNESPEEQEPLRESAPSPPATRDAVTVAERIIPTVVGISTTKISRDSFLEPRLAKGVGSGVIVRPDGYILTNEHVVSGAKEIDVTFDDGRKEKGRVLWSDPGLDLAVVKINARGLPTAPLGDSQQLRVGEPVIAVGNPLGLRFQRTVTAGIVSALDRVISVPAEDDREKVMENLIQTDASINPGNSGGPLVNGRGQVVGVNTVKVTSAEGIGFSIPINVAKPIVESVARNGKFVRPVLGVVAFDRDVAMFYDKKMNLDRGLLIMEVIKNSPADRAGLKKNDIILQVDNRVVNSMLELRELLYSLPVNTKVDITYWRNGRILKTSAKLAAASRIE